MAMLIEPLALETPIAAFNGGTFVAPDMTIIEEHVLAADVARRAVELICRHGMDVWVYSGSDWLIHNPAAPHVAREQSDGQVRADRPRGFRASTGPSGQDRGRERRS